MGRLVPVIPVRLGHSPRGFLARVQALSCNWENAAHRIVELLIVNDGMFTAYVQATRDCGSYDNANLLAKILPSVEELADDQIAELVDAYNGNSQVYDSFFSLSSQLPFLAGSSSVWHSSSDLPCSSTPPKINSKHSTVSLPFSARVLAFSVWYIAMIFLCEKDWLNALMAPPVTCRIKRRRLRWLRTEPLSVMLQALGEVAIGGIQSQN